MLHCDLDLTLSKARSLENFVVSMGYEILITIKLPAGPFQKIILKFHILPSV